MNIAILAAMDKEFALLHSQLLDFSDSVIVDSTDAKCLSVKIDSHNIILVKCGVGKVNAAVTACKLLSSESSARPDIIISTGVGGGFGDGLNIGDVVIADRCAYHDVYCGSDVQYGQVMELPLYYKSETLPAVAERFKEQKGGFPWGNVHVGLTVTGDWFVDSVAKAQDITSHFPDALMVDMESAAVAQVCFLNNVQYGSIRMVSDMPLGGDNRRQYDNFWNEAPQWLAESTFMLIRDLIGYNSSLENKSNNK